MTDIRENALARLQAIAEGLVTADVLKTAKRNVHAVTETALPSMVILDGDELAENGDPVARPGKASRRVGMSPEIYLSCAEKPEDVGAALNALRVAVLKAIMTDAPLATILGTTGIIRYEGCSSSLALGRAMDGTMKVNFTFFYYLQPEKL